MSGDTLYDFITPVVSASVVLLRENGLTTVPQVQRGTGSLVTPRVEIQVGIGAPTGHAYVTSPSSSVWDSYNGTIRANVITNRKENDVSHSLYVSKVHNVLSNPANFMNRLNDHYILRVGHGGTTQTYNNDITTDTTTMNFDFVIIIKKSAWSS